MESTMRMYSLIDRSSAFASLARASSSDGGTRSFNSSVHFSDISTQQKRAGADIAVRPATSAARMTALQGGIRERQAGMLGGLLVCLFGITGCHDLAYLIGAQGRHIITPLVNGGLRNAQRGGQFFDAAEGLDSVVRFHGHIISMPIRKVQAF